MKIKTVVSLIMTLFMIVSTLSVVTAEENHLGESIGLSVNKKVFNGSAWVNSLDAEIDDKLVFRLTIIYDPTTVTAEKATDLIVIDTLPACLEYNFSTAINYGNETEYYGQSFIDGNQIYWNLTEQWEIELYNQSIHDQDNDKFKMVEIFYNATVIAYTDLDGEDNVVDVTGLEVDTEAQLEGQGIATLIVTPSEPGLDIEKKVFDEAIQDWAETTTVTEEDIVTFQIKVMNTGYTYLSNIIVRDELPEFLTYVDSSIEPDFVPGYIQWSICIEAGEYRIIEVQAEACDVGQGSNLASAEHGQLYVENTADVLVEAGNLAPDAPVVDGPETGLLGTKIDFTLNTTDPEGDDVLYYITYSEADDGWLGPFPSGVQQTVNHTFATTGEKVVKAMAKDIYGHESVWGNEIIINITTNDPPAVPELTGDTEAYQMALLEFLINTTEPEGDDVFYYVDFGDGNNSGWLGPYEPGVIRLITKLYELPGEYDVMVKAKDVYDQESAFSAPMTVTILAQNPPALPVVSGDEEGTEGEEVSFTVNTTDAEGDDVSYFIDFGDGNNSGWMDLVEQGVKQTVTYIYAEPGDYKVKAKAMDRYGFESAFGEEHNITINEKPPVKDLKVSINTGLNIGKVSIKVENTGEVALNNVEWNITGSYGLLFKKEINESGTIESIDVGESEIVEVTGIRKIGLINVAAGAAVDGIEAEIAEAGGFIFMRLIWLS